MNVVSTDYYRKEAAKAEAGQAPLPVVTQMSFGDGAYQVDGITIRTPLSSDYADPGDQGLRNELVTVPIETISFPIETTVRFSGRLTFTEPNTLDKNINEIALKDAAGNVLAIKSFDPIPKNDENEFVAEWDEAF